MTAGSMIKLLRTAKNIPQGILAENLRVTRSYLSQVENGRKQPSLGLLKDAAISLKVPLILFVSDDSTNAIDENIRRELKEITAKLLTLYLDKRNKPL